MNPFQDPLHSRKKSIKKCHPAASASWLAEHHSRISQGHRSAGKPARRHAGVRALLSRLQTLGLMLSCPSFNVVAPSLPGVGYSTVLPEAGATVVDNARIFDTLMTKVLGYKTYVGQGGDFGSINLRQIQIRHSNTLKLACVPTSS
jgi:hypothetical protein